MLWWWWQNDTTMRRWIHGGVQTEIPLVAFGLVPWAATFLAVRTDRCDVVCANTGRLLRIECMNASRMH